MKNPIYITSQDNLRLTRLLQEARQMEKRDRGDLGALEKELERAVVVAPAEIPPEVITMNSTAELLDLDSGEAVLLTLVFPQDADIDAKKISILAPIGAGMLGYKVGDEFEWQVPGGLRRMKVIRIDYQPEAAGDFDR
jgi:regulator of nucleoside diphosphate kinase